MAQLRARLGAAEEVNQDLIAFAQGHWGAVASIHRAVLAIVAAETIEELYQTVAHDWPAILGIDSASLVLADRQSGSLGTRYGIQPIDPAIVRTTLAGLARVTMREVTRGHPLFGADCAAIRSEALIRLDCGDSHAAGLLLLGQTAPIGIEDSRGLDLLQFLGASLAAMIGRCLNRTSD
ncbi:MAG: DUF484 family protein [Sphingomicrobium sp.]